MEEDPSRRDPGNLVGYALIIALVVFAVIVAVLLSTSPNFYQFQNIQPSL